MDNRKGVEHRLAIIEGHLKAVRKMLVEGKSGLEVVKQSRAVQSALRKFDSAVLEQYMEASVAADIANGMTAKAAKELGELFELL